MPGHVRFIENVYLDVNVKDNVEKIPFGFGEIYPVKCVIDKGEYNDIIFVDGSIAKDVAGRLFEKLKCTTIEQKKEKIVINTSKGKKQEKKGLFGGIKRK